MADTHLHPADAHDTIRVRGARENNLRGVDLDLPKRRLTVFTGVSGSGKSSLAFGTIASESQRMINETYSAFVQGFLPQLGRPEVDALEGLTTAILVDQERLGANIRSTVGTASDANALLRTLFSRMGDPQIGPPNAFSFNTPSVKASGAILVERAGNTKRQRAEFNVLGGMCPGCDGTGRVSDLDLTQLFCLTFEVDFFVRHGFTEIVGEVVDRDVYSELLLSKDDGVAEFLDLARVKPNTLGNTRMIRDL